jgi:phospholipase C
MTGAIAVGCVATLVAVVPATAKLTAIGHVHCTATGKVRFRPRLQPTPDPNTKLKVSAKLTCTLGTTGDPSVNVMGGRLRASIGALTAGCTTTEFGPGTGTVSWRATGGAVTKSTLSWDTATVTDGSHITVDLHGPGAAAEAGSYADREVRLHVVSDTTSGGLCGDGARRFAFTGAGGTSTLDITAPNPNNLPLAHVLVLMQENRSADHYLGRLATQGQPNYEAEPNVGNPDPTNPFGPPILPFHQTAYCEVADLDHSWNGTHNEVNGGAMDGFTAANVDPNDPTGSRAMGYYDQTDLPFYYALYSAFATGDRYFCSALTQTFPNRLYLLAGTSFGHIRNDVFGSTHTSVFELLDASAVTWKIYASQYPLGYGWIFFQYVQDHAAEHVFPIDQYFTDAMNGDLPDVSFVDPDVVASPATENDEHPPSNVQVGQQFVADILNALMSGPAWSSSAFFLTYDEHGGYYDHVVPPAAPIPDAIPPMLEPNDIAGAFDQYGVRVPVVVVSPYSKPAFVSHVVHDHTSILRFIEYRFGLPSLSNRDAAADPMLEFFDFTTPAFATPPSLPAAVVDPNQLAACGG